MHPRAFGRLSFILILMLVLQICVPNTGASAAPLAALGNGVLFEEDFSDNSAGWTLGNEWQIGPAAASSGHEVGNPDPAQDHTPTDDNGVAGVRIGGNASTAFSHDYYYLTSPVINTASAPGTLTLEYWRWLNSDYEPYMLNRVEVYNGSSWVTVWQSGDNTGITTWIRDTTWMPITHDITAHKNANMQVRFGFNMVYYYAGYYVFNVSSWNLDDVRIFGPNVAPAAQNSNLETDEDTPLDITLAAMDGNNDPLTYAIVTGPAHGTLTGTGASRTYTPEANYHGSDSFTFKVNDGLEDSNTATVSITVMSVEDVPDADDQTLETVEDTPLAITLTASDGDNDPLTFTIVNSPAHGTLSGTAPNLTYSPHANYNGPDSFTFIPVDGKSDAPLGTVSITVLSSEDIPVAENQSVTTQEDTPLAITLTASDGDDDPLTYVVDDPAHGTLSGTPPNLTYAPTANYNGPDSFTFIAEDGKGGSAPATISIIIAAVEDVPVAEDVTLVTNEDTPLDISLPTVDVDGDPLIYTLVDLPENGALSGTAPDLVYTPDENYNGPDSFTFYVNDGDDDSNTATVSITVDPVNDAPIAGNDNLTGDEDTPLAFTLPVSDVEGDGLTYTIEMPLSNGTISGEVPDLVYTPNPDFNGPETFVYSVNDGTDDSNIGLIEFTITPVNDAPVVEDGAFSGPEDMPIDVTLTGTDVEGDFFTHTLITLPEHGTLTGEAPDLVYTPDDNFNGTDSFTYVINDGEYDSNTATVSLTVDPVDDPTQARSGVALTEEDTPVGITLTVSEVDGDTLTYTIVTAPAHGTLSGDAPNLTYTPNENYNGPDSFEFLVNDGTSDSNTAEIGIVITAENDVPTAHDLALELDEDTSAALTLTGSDVEEQPLTFTVMSQPEHGMLTGTAPDLTYTPDEDYNGPDSFTYLVVDESEHSTIATVSITVAPVNDAPMAEVIPNQSWASRREHEFVIVGFCDVDGDELAYSALLQGGAALPSWLVMDADGVLSGTPSDADVGSYEIVVTADDGQGGTEQGLFILTVTQTPYPHYFPLLRHLK